MTSPVIALILGTAALAWMNGANDNFKSVATLHGSRALGYRGSLVLASISTLCGGLLSFALAQGLISTFSGRDLVSAGSLDEITLASAGVAAASAIGFATVLGMPTSTTHALLGSLVGASLNVDPNAIEWRTLFSRVAQPMILSPLLAIAATAGLYRLLHRARLAAGITSRSCVCVGRVESETKGLSSSRTAVGIGGSETIMIGAGTVEDCRVLYGGAVAGVDAQSGVEAIHFLSAGLVAFARAVNDTPKIAALSLATTAIPLAGRVGWIVSLVVVAMVLGGWFQSRRVAETMSRRITDLNPGQGLIANLVTAVLVIGASRWGLPVSTTHVSCGAIFGIGAVNGRCNGKTILGILTAWVTTLPLSMALGALVSWLLRRQGV